MSRLVSEEGFERFPVNYLIVSLILIFRTNVLFGVGGFKMAVGEELFIKMRVEDVLIRELFSTDNIFIYLCVVIYLLLALICVANLIKFIAGPLRLLN